VRVTVFDVKFGYKNFITNKLFPSVNIFKKYTKYILLLLLLLLSSSLLLLSINSLLILATKQKKLQTIAVETTNNVQYKG
jgi:hypothetical protein